MFRQYREMKAKSPDALLFFRMGDFYELFGEDAVWTAAALELTLTSRNRGAPDEVPMCGLPHHAAEGYLRRLLDLGKKVAIAEQVEDPRQAKGLVRRDIVRVLTPGTAVEGLDGHESAWLAAITGGPGAWALARLDVSTGDLRVCEPDDFEDLLAELGRIEARELLLGPNVDDPQLRAATRIPCVTEVAEPADTGPDLARLPSDEVAPLRAGRIAVSVLLRYAVESLAGRVSNIAHVYLYRLGGSMVLDDATRRNLELFRPLRGTGRVGTAVALLDEARTAMGGRLLREWLGAPLIDLAAIRARHDAVASFVSEGAVRSRVRELLGQVADIERISGKVAQNTANPYL
jgi:DNA mismatch repair protein MutS